MYTCDYSVFSDDVRYCSLRVGEQKRNTKQTQGPGSWQDSCSFLVHQLKSDKVSLLRYCTVALTLYWSFVRKTYGDARSKTGKVSNHVNGPVPWNVPPLVLTSDGNFGKSTFPCTVQ